MTHELDFIQFVEDKPKKIKRGIIEVQRFINNMKEMYISNNELVKTKNINFVTSLQKGIETVNNISNNLYNYYTNQNDDEVLDLPYK